MHLVAVNRSVTITAITALCVVFMMCLRLSGRSPWAGGSHRQQDRLATLHRRCSTIAAAWLGAKLYCDACAARFLPCWNKHGVRNDPLNGSNRNRESDRMRQPLDAV